MRLQLKHVVALALAALLFGAPLLAQDKAALFAQLDTNQDGFVSLDEVPAEHRAKFERLLKLAGKEEEKKLNKALFEGAVRADKSGSDAVPAGGKSENRSRESDDLFTRLDVNKDGVVQTDEVAAAQKATFEQLLKNGDIDGDGKLTRDEYAASTKATETPRRPGRGGAGPGQARQELPPGLRELFARADSNGDGKLSKEEVQPRVQENFDRLDTDGDGSLSPEEYARVAARFGQRPPPGAGGAPPPGSLPVVFALLDTNRDGELSTSEIVAAGTALLKLDRNGDGKLTPDEVFAAAPGRPQRPPQP